MNDQLTIYYDEEGDFLEMSVGDDAKGSFKNMGDDIFERIDKKNYGIAIHGFRKRTQGQKNSKLSLPVKI